MFAASTPLKKRPFKPPAFAASLSTTSEQSPPGGQEMPLVKRRRLLASPVVRAAFGGVPCERPGAVAGLRTEFPPTQHAQQENGQQLQAANASVYSPVELPDVKLKIPGSPGTGCMPTPDAQAISDKLPGLVTPAAIRSIREHLLPQALRMPSLSLPYDDRVQFAGLEDSDDAMRPAHKCIHPPCLYRPSGQQTLTERAEQELMDLTVCDNDDHDEEHSAGAAALPDMMSGRYGGGQETGACRGGASFSRRQPLAISDQLACQQREYEEIWSSPEKQLEEVRRQPSLLLAAPGVTLDLLRSAFSA